MKIAVIGANGKAGQLIVEEALAKGLDVTAIIRSENKSKASKVIKKDLFDLNSQDLKDFDVVVSAFGVWNKEDMDKHTKVANHLCSLLKNTNTRLLFVGGAASLYVDKEHKTMLLDTPEFPEIYKDVAKASLDALNAIRSYNDVNWTYLSPAAEFIPDGAKTGKYKLGGEELVVSADGRSAISYADYALAMVDEIINGSHIKERISVVWQ